jgi:hypothetical protein
MNTISLNLLQGRVSVATIKAKSRQEQPSKVRPVQCYQFQNILVNVKNPPLKPVLESEILEVEAQLGLVFPADYKEFVTTFGAGELSVIGLQAFTPHDVMEIFRYESQERLAEFWFWEESPEILTQQKAIECFPFFGSAQGDDILFHPSDPNTWFILPHEEQHVVTVHTFNELVNYYVERERIANGSDFKMPEFFDFLVW